MKLRRPTVGLYLMLASMLALFATKFGLPYATYAFWVLVLAGFAALIPFMRLWNACLFLMMLGMYASSQADKAGHGWLALGFAVLQVSAAGLMVYALWKIEIPRARQAQLLKDSLATTEITKDTEIG
jgi:prepilin signal peptidase PulO-like enzyme (type II secretory pathway)